MLAAFIQQCLIFIALYYTYSGRWYESNINDDEIDIKQSDEKQREIFLAKFKFPETGLILYEPLVLTIPQELLFGVIIDGRFQVGHFLGGGWTGSVRSAIDLVTGQSVAIKFAEKELHHSLEKEFINYLYLGADDPDIVKHGIPHVIHFGDFAGYKVLVMTKTGQTLHNLRATSPAAKFSIESICKIAIQAVRIFQYIHSKGLLFHDVKPANIAIGEEDVTQIFFFDFAFSEFYVNAFGEPKQRQRAEVYNGTPEFFARGPLNRLTHVRKDDFISFGICLLELNGAYIPWMDKIDPDDGFSMIMDMVLEEWDRHSIEEVCDSSENPELFVAYFGYFDGIKPDEEPDYDLLVELFASQLTDEERENSDLGLLDTGKQYYENEQKMVERFKGKVINDRFKIGGFLGGYYKKLLLSGWDLVTGMEVCIRIASNEYFYWLARERENYLLLDADDPDIAEYGIPQFLYYGVYDKYRVLVTSKTGTNLERLWNAANSKFNIETVFKIAVKSIRVLEYIHFKGLVYHDVKAAYISISDKSPYEIFFTDFAFTDFQSKALNQENQRKKARYYKGTPEYMAIEPLQKFEHAQKDDLVSLGIVLLSLNDANIPWLNMNQSFERADFLKRFELVLEQREKHPLKEISQTSDNPAVFEKYFEYLDNLEAHERADYETLERIFSTELTNETLTDDDFRPLRSHNSKECRLEVQTECNNSNQ